MSITKLKVRIISSQRRKPRQPVFGNYTYHLPLFSQRANTKLNPLVKHVLVFAIRLLTAQLIMPNSQPYATHKEQMALRQLLPTHDESPTISDILVLDESQDISYFSNYICQHIVKKPWILRIDTVHFQSWFCHLLCDLGNIHSTNVDVSQYMLRTGYSELR